MSELPQGFNELEVFVSAWAQPTENQRSHKRWVSTVGDFKSFYEAMMPRLKDILAYLDQYEVGAIPERNLSLYHLALAFAESSPHVEMYKGSAKVPNSFDASRLEAAKGNVKDI